MTARLATAGRLAAIGAAVLTLLGLFAINLNGTGGGDSISIFKTFSHIDILSALGCIGLGAAGGFSIVQPQRILDVAITILAALLAGFILEFAIEDPANSLFALLVWIVLMATAVCAGGGLTTGQAETDPELMSGLNSMIDKAQAKASTVGQPGAPQQHAQQPPAPPRPNPSPQPAQPQPQPVAASPAPAQSSSAPAPGWYPEGSQLRWWDGSQWTEHTRPA